MDFGNFHVFDRYGMDRMIADLPHQFTRPIEWFPADTRFPAGITRAALCGLGGSALPGDIVNHLFGRGLGGLTVAREYDLPPGLDASCLTFVASFSGNTEETLACYEQAHAARLPVCVITKGGRLAELARERGDPLLVIDEKTSGFQPRFGYGYFYAFILLALDRAGLLAGVRDHLREAAARLGDFDPVPAARTLAERLDGKIPLFYSNTAYERSTARILKIKFNENTKVPAFYNALPEMNHNEMVGFTNVLGAPLAAVLLRDPDDHPRVAKRFEALKNVLDERGVPHVEYTMPGDSPWERVFKTLYTFDRVTYYLACHYGYDPTPVELVEGFKQALTR